MDRQSFRWWAVAGVALFAVLASPVLTAQGICQTPMDGDVAAVYYEPDAIYWEPLVEYDRLILRVDAPCDTIEKIFKRGEKPVFELRQVVGLVDGSYRWEVRVEPLVDPEVREALERFRETGDDSILAQLQVEGLTPKGPFVEGEAFSVVNGRIVRPELVEEKPRLASRSSTSGPVGVSVSGAVSALEDGVQSGDNRLLPKDVLHYDDVIITGSLCVGFDCVNGESFGYDTILVKENNLRIGFNDTSTGSFPTGNWQIRANDATSGGASYLAFVDMGADGAGGNDGDIVFAVEAGAPSGALYVDDGGRVGLGTKIPYVELHIVDGDSPTVRLDQDGTSGFAAQRWDVVGNETNFFVRDVTNGSKLPFRIRPGAPSNSIYIDPDGNVGFGTSSPDYDLDIDDGTSDPANFVVRGTSGSMILQDMNATSGRQAAQNLVSDGTWRLRGLSDDLSGQTVRGITVDLADGDVGILCDSSLGADLTVGSQSSCSSGTRSTMNAGDTTFTASSSRTIKENIEPIRVEDILDRIRKVAVYRYDFIEGPDDRIGLMAEDFHDIFHRGSDQVLSGQEVQMALWLAVQKLSDRLDGEHLGQLEAIEAQNRELLVRQAELEREIARLERVLSATGR